MAYTDLTATFIYRQLVTWPRMDALAENDAYDRIPVGTVKLFFQAAAPTGWTKLTSQNDKALRVVSGSGGGSGGTYAVSSGLDLSHTHTVNAHTHAQPDHQHNIDANNISALAVGTGQGVFDLSTTISVLSTSGAAHNWPVSQTAIDGTVASGSASPTTDSQLGTVILKYIDLIACSKD